jgi:hypothetical protein
MMHNTPFCTDTVIPGFIQNVESRTHRKTLNGWSIHVDDARPHNSEPAQRCIKASRAKRLPHPVCSPELAPRNSFLFGYLERKLSDYIYESRENLVNTLTEFLIGISQEVMPNVFESWVNRPKWVIKYERKYYTQERQGRCAVHWYPRSSWTRSKRPQPCCRTRSGRPLGRISGRGRVS